jgi:hypothetical protein
MIRKVETKLNAEIKETAPNGDQRLIKTETVQSATFFAAMQATDGEPFESRDAPSVAPFIDTTKKV